MQQPENLPEIQSWYPREESDEHEETGKRKENAPAERVGASDEEGTAFPGKKAAEKGDGP